MGDGRQLTRQERGPRQTILSKPWLRNTLYLHLVPQILLIHLFQNLRSCLLAQGTLCSLKSAFHAGNYLPLFLHRSAPRNLSSAGRAPSIFRARPQIQSIPLKPVASLVYRLYLLKTQCPLGVELCTKRFATWTASRIGKDIVEFSGVSSQRFPQSQIPGYQPILQSARFVWAQVLLRSMHIVLASFPMGEVGT
jgi:hypothetical protein